MSVPKGWTYKRLSELANYVNGYSFKPEDWGEDGLPIIRIEQLKNPDAPTDYFAGKLPTSKLIDDGDLIFSWSASLFLSIWSHGPAALNQHLFKVTEAEGVDRAFLKWFIEFHLPSLLAASHGSTMQHITRKELDRFGAPFPDERLEQSSIAEALSTVDRAIEQTSALIAKQQRIATGLREDLLFRGLDKNGFVRSEETHEFRDSPLGRIPVAFELKRLVQITPKNAPIGYGIVQPGPYDHSGVKVAGIYTINSEFERWHMSSASIERAYGRSRIQTGDVLLSIKGTTGRVGVVPAGDEGNISRDIARIRPDATVNSEYLRFLMLSDRFQKYLLGAEVGTTRAELSIKILRELFVSLPSREEQDEVARRLASIEEDLKASAALLEKTKSLKTGIMKDLLSAAVRVTDLSKESA